jgi:hypothetical protein
MPESTVEDTDSNKMEEVKHLLHDANPITLTRKLLSE